MNNEKVVEQLRETQKEVARFSNRLIKCINRLKEDGYALMGCKETGALKRAALDLKNELSTITKGFK